MASPYNFQVGDEVKILKAYIDADKIGSIRKVVKIENGEVFLKGCVAGWNKQRAHEGKALKLVTSVNQNKIMSLTLVQKFRIALKGEPAKTLINRGILEMDESFTQEGWRLFKAFLLTKFGQEFTDSVVSQIPEDKKA